MLTDYQLRSLSYRVRESCPPGTAVTFRQSTRHGRPLDTRAKDWTFEYREFLPGELFTVIDYTNAGFRGIEVGVQDDDGKRWFGISAGYLEAVTA